jgi:hypothetical protein
LEDEVGQATKRGEKETEKEQSISKWVWATAGGNQSTKWFMKSNQGSCLSNAWLCVSMSYHHFSKLMQGALTLQATSKQSWPESATDWPR